MSSSPQDSFSKAPAIVARPAAQRARPSLYPFPCFLVVQSASRIEALSECVMMARLPSVRSFLSLRVAASSSRAPHLLRYFLGIMCSRVYWLNPSRAVLLMPGRMALSNR